MPIKKFFNRDNYETMIIPGWANVGDTFTHKGALVKVTDIHWSVLVVSSVTVEILYYQN